MSTHAVKVIEIREVRPHDNAERLEIIPIGGWQAVAKKGQFKPGDRAIYIEPDYVVPTTNPLFSFLAKDGKDTHRLRAVRLRGALSFGLLTEVPPELCSKVVGDDVMEDLGIVRYVPPARSFKGSSDGHELPADEWPAVFAPKFDIENIQNYMDVLAPGEPVVVTEKIDGANARYVCVGGKLFMGSRTRWLRPDCDHFWSRALSESPEIEKWCAAHEGCVLYGEVYGPVQSLKYGVSEPRFAAFAGLGADGVWMDHAPLWKSLRRYRVRSVPVITEQPFDMNDIRQIAEQDSLMGGQGHIMEGVVIVPKNERRHDIVGRVAFKYISARFWVSEN